MIVVSISGLYSLHASSLLPFGQPKMSPDIARCPLERWAKSPLVENHCLKHLSLGVMFLFFAILTLETSKKL